MEPNTPSITYPQNFDIKIVVVSTIPMEETRQNISRILSQCKVVHSFVDIHSSAKGSYYSYCYNIDIESQEHLRHTYEQLRSLPGIRFAL